MNRSQRRISKTIIAAFVVTLIVIWQVIEVSAGGGLFGKFAGEGKSVAAAANERESIPRGEIRPSTDPVAAYLARAKRGMTEQEIRWIISDFEAIGFMPTSLNPNDLRGYWEKQNDWYLTALSQALSLTSKQKQEVRASLKESLNQNMKWITETKDGEANQGAATLMLHGMYFNPAMRMRDESYAPWNLCALTEVQSGLTMEREWRGRENPIAQSYADYEPGWLTFNVIAMKDPASGNLIEYPPPSIMDLACHLLGTIRGGIMDISTAFPLTPDQTLADHRNDLAAQAKMLHPAQLRMALLLNPSLTVSLMMMDKPAPDE